MYLQEIFDAVSPLREAAAYEALWDKSNASVKKIAEIVKDHENMLLSQLISSDLIDTYFQKLKEIITSKHKQFEISFKGEADYPKKLLDAKYPTPLLYYKGAWDLVFSPSIAVVGTRKPSDEGVKRTQRLVKSLVEDNFSIVSGLAEGIDTIAHETAIKCKGRTIAVIGTSINNYYPKKNEKLQTEIASKHLLISQVPLIRYSKQNYLTNRFFFPERNKTMSALSLGTIIVEARETSGSLIQAEAALQQNRKLFILESCFLNKNLTWPEKFLKKGAIRVKDYSDIHNNLINL